MTFRKVERDSLGIPISDDTSPLLRQARKEQQQTPRRGPR